MKSSFALLAFVAGLATAQDLPQCSLMCWNNMLGIARTDFGCADGDKACQCSQINFGYGVRDCAQQACTPDEAQQAIAYGTNYCAGVEASPAEISTGALPVLSSALESAVATATGSGEGEAQSTAITTEALVATITASDGNVVTTTTGFSTVYSSLTGAAASAASSAASAASSAVESATGSAASAASSALESASGAASSAASAASSLASAASSALESATASGTNAQSTGAAPMMTGLPVAGAVGLAALLLL